MPSDDDQNELYCKNDFLHGIGYCSQRNSKVSDRTLWHTEMK